MLYSDEEIKQKVQLSLDLLLKNDIFLLEHEVNERAVAHKLAEYLQQQFIEWNVDCEYNKKGLDIKELDGIKGCSEQKTTDRVNPDIIVHQRNATKNLLVIEIKTISNDEACDNAKLELFTKSTGKYKYKLGLFIKFNTTKYSLKWYKDGAKID